MNINQNALDTTVKSNGMEKTTYYYAVYTYIVNGVTFKETTTVSSSKGFPLAELMLYVAKEVGIEPTDIVIEWFTSIPKNVRDNFRKMIDKHKNTNHPK